MIEARFVVRLPDFDLNADLKDSGIILLTGENGSGKTTFLRTLAGIVSHDTGYVKLNGKDLSGKDVHERGIVYLNQNSFFDHLTVDRHIRFAAGSADESVANGLKNEFGVNLDRRVRELSLGQKMRVSIVTALLSNPGAILLDEVLSNLSNLEELLGAIRSYCADHSIDVIIVSHSFNESLADHHYEMNGGKMRRLF